MASYRKNKPPKLGGKSYKPWKPAHSLEKNDLKHIYISECAYDENLHIVCPNCGLYNMSMVTSLYAPTHSTYIGVCRTPGCNTMYQFHVQRGEQ